MVELEYGIYGIYMVLYTWYYGTLVQQGDVNNIVMQCGQGLAQGSLVLTSTQGMAPRFSNYSEYRFVCKNLRKKKSEIEKSEIEKS